MSTKARAAVAAKKSEVRPKTLPKVRRGLRPLETVARELAAAHRQADPDTSIIKFFPTNQNEIRLLEVSRIAPTTGEILPFRFAADVKHRVEYPSIVILVSPEEWHQIEAAHLELPKGWDLNTARDL